MSEEKKRKGKEMEEKRKPSIGKGGVMAKRAAMNEAAERMRSGVAEIQSSVKALQGEMKKSADDFKAYARDFYLG